MTPLETKLLESLRWAMGKLRAPFHSAVITTDGYYHTCEHCHEHGFGKKCTDICPYAKAQKLLEGKP